MTAARPIHPSPLERHIEFLERRVFQVETRWPHYRRLLSDLRGLADRCGAGERVLSLERASVFGGTSLFAPLFERGRVFAYDVRLDGLEEARLGHQAHWTEDPDCLRRPVDASGPADRLPIPSNFVDWVVVPNVVHHVKNQAGLFGEIARVLKPGGRGYIFETLLRELHQAPHDFVRYTPWGFEAVLEEVGLELAEWRPAGGPFEAIAYCWDQALQYLPEALRVERRRWFEETHFPELMALDRRHRDNQVRAHTSFPIAYGIHFGKPGAG